MLLEKGAKVDAANKDGWTALMASSENMTAFIVGNVVAVVVAILAIKFFISYLKKYGFRVFGIYRIVAGIILLLLMMTDHL